MTQAMPPSVCCPGTDSENEWFLEWDTWTMVHRWIEDYLLFEKMSFNVFHVSHVVPVSLLVLRFCVCSSGFWIGEIACCLRCDAMPRLVFFF